MKHSNQPFNHLPPLPPAVQLETTAVLKKAIAANRRLAELKGLVNSIPNQDILVNGIVLQEARLSSEIENIVTTNDDLYRAAADEKLATDPPFQRGTTLSRSALAWLPGIKIQTPIN